MTRYYLIVAEAGKRTARSVEQVEQVEQVEVSVYQSLARFRYQLRLFDRFSENAARAAGLTPSQHQLLLAIKGWWGDDLPTITDVAELLQLKHHSTVELAKRTQARGMIRIVTDPGDGRRRQLILTTAGERTLQDLAILHRDEIRRFRRQLNDILTSLDDRQE